MQLGYFAQHQLDTLRADESALWHLQKIAPQQTEQQLRDYLGGFAFHGDKVNQPVASFSGGEKARLVLALIVWQRPNLLLLDEPTNHMDMESIESLNMALEKYNGTLISFRMTVSLYLHWLPKSSNWMAKADMNTTWAITKAIWRKKVWLKSLPTI